LRADGYLKVLDFGLAKLKERESSAAGSGTITIDPALTSDGAIIGTAAYMCPEQACGRPVDSRCDIFSLALVLFECWQGQNPFRREVYSGNARKAYFGPDRDILLLGQGKRADLLFG
jgi:serine/threonine protein kinase